MALTQSHWRAGSKRFALADIRPPRHRAARGTELEDYVEGIRGSVRGMAAITGGDGGLPLPGRAAP